jgi:hypothetical protein
MMMFRQLESKSGNENEGIESVSEKMRVKWQRKSETKYMRFSWTILLEPWESCKSLRRRGSQGTLPQRKNKQVGRPKVDHCLDTAHQGTPCLGDAHCAEDRITSGVQSRNAVAPGGMHRQVPLPKELAAETLRHLQNKGLDVIRWSNDEYCWDLPRTSRGSELCSISGLMNFELMSRIILQLKVFALTLACWAKV